MKKGFAVLLVLTICLTLFGWGSGHDDHAGLVLKHLPDEITSHWNNAVKKEFRTRWSHYPDSQKEIAPEIRNLIGPEASRFLNETRIRTCYQFHSDSGKGVAFFLLVRAFREKQYEAAAFFAGVLLHGIADANAFNHAPLIHFLTYTRYRHIRYPHADLDLSMMRKNGKLAEKIAERLSAFRPDGGRENLRETVLKLMLEEIDSNAYMCSRENLLALVNPDGTPSDAALNAMADVAAYQTRIGVNAICSAWRLASSGEPLALKPSDFDAKAFAALPESEKSSALRPEYERRRSKKLEQRDPRTDAIYAGLFDVRNEKGSPRTIGLICEATYAMNQSFLGFGSKFLIGSLGRTLLKNGKSVQAIPMYDLKNSVPSPEQIPVIVLCSNAGAPGLVSSALKKYVVRGGKMVVIGGRSDLNLTGLAPFFERRENGEIPVSSAYGRANQDRIGKMRILPAKAFAGLFGKESFAFKDNPNTPAGWNKPFSNIAIRTGDGSVIPLFELDNGNGRFCIAAMKRNSRGEVTGAWIPQYLLMPFLFSEDSSMPDWSKVELDSFGTRLALMVFDQLLVP